MNSVVVYSSVTGNARSVAEAILTPPPKAPPPEAFDFLALGFWVRRAGPDPRMLRYMSRVKNKTVTWFDTLAAWPDSPHTMTMRANTATLLTAIPCWADFFARAGLRAAASPQPWRARAFPDTP